MLCAIIQNTSWRVAIFFFCPWLVWAFYPRDPKQFRWNLHFKLFAFPVQEFMFSEELRLQRLSGWILLFLKCCFAYSLWIDTVSSFITTNSDVRNMNFECKCNTCSKWCLLMMGFFFLIGKIFSKVNLGFLRFLFVVLALDSHTWLSPIPLLQSVVNQPWCIAHLSHANRFVHVTMEKGCRHLCVSQTSGETRKVKLVLN